MPRLCWILPLLQLFLSAATTWPARSYIQLEIQNAWTGTEQPRPVHLNFRSTEELESKLERVPSQATAPAELWYWTPVALNIPVIVTQLPYIILNPQKTDWVPRNMDFKVWRAIAWPFFGLPFWWIAGRGFDRLTRRVKSSTRIRWIELLPATLALGSGALICTGLIVSPEFRTEKPLIFGAGGPLWVILGGATLVAFIVQRRRHPGSTATASPTVLPR